MLAAAGRLPPSPGLLQSFALGFPHQGLRSALPFLPPSCTISSPSASYLTTCPHLLTIPPCSEYSKDLLEEGGKWFALGPQGVNCPQALLLPGPCSRLTCTVTPISSQVLGAGLAAHPRNALYIREARLLTGVPGAFAVGAKGVPITLAAGHLEWDADHQGAGRLNH